MRRRRNRVERQRLTNAAEIDAARAAITEPLIEQYLQKHPDQSRATAATMVQEDARQQLESRQPSPKFETAVNCYKRHRSNGTGSN